MIEIVGFYLSTYYIDYVVLSYTYLFPKSMEVNHHSVWKYFFVVTYSNFDSFQFEFPQTDQALASLDHI